MRSASSGHHDSNARPVRLDRDILFLIFNLNGNMFSNKDALKDARHSSQVCSDWRDVILNMPSLWGKLIDLDALTQEDHKWRDEVLRRSSNSPLSIRGLDSLTQHSCQITLPNGGSEQRDGLAPWQMFFFSVLDHHWSRIERLTVSIETSMVDLQRWQAVRCASPLLRVFQVHVDSEFPDNPILPIGIMFANNAPLLEIFHAKNIKFDIPANVSWLSTICSIHIGSIQGLSEMLDLLKLTPLLETLVVLQNLHQPQLSSSGSRTRPPSISLPKLKSVDLDAGREICFPLLEHISNLGTCSLRIRTSIGMITPRLSAYLRALSRATEDYFTFHIPKAISLEIRASRHLAFYLGMDDETSPDSTFSLSISTGNGRMTPILDALSIPVFNTVMRLKLTLTGNIGAYDVPPRSLLLSFPSVTILHIQGENIEYMLSVIQNSADILFPLLEIVKLTHPSGELRGQVIHEFLQARKDAGRPISVLDLTDCKLLDIRHMVNLEERMDLKVL